MPPTDRPVVIHLRRTAWVILGVLLVAPWGVLVWSLRDRPVAAPLPAAVKPAAPTAVPGAKPDVTRARPGPWGELEYYSILIEPPEQLIVADYTQPDVVRWVFKGYTEASLAALWQQAGLTAAQVKELGEPARRDITPDAVTVRPTRELIIDLSPEARAKIYAALAAFPENAPQFSPFRLRADAVPTWFDDSGLSPETVALTRKMFYRRGGDVVFFSDDDIVLPTLESAGERVKFIKTLSRKSALFVQLRVRPGTDVESIARYWGHSRRAKDLRPLLQSLARRPDGGTIDIVHLLPGFARALLYTYPLPTDPATQAAHDCHWTSFNFFNDQPDERFASIDFVRQTLLSDYYVVPGEANYGDILMFLRPDGVVVHSCVYLADELVFTKNGSDFSVPWQIATIATVKALYSLNANELEVRRYRRNDR